MQPMTKMRRPAHYYTYIRSVQWKAVRHEYLRRTGWKCENCHIRNSRVLHHLNYDRLGYEQPEDLIALCSECHERMHAWPRMNADNDNQLQLPLEGREARRR